MDGIQKIKRAAQAARGGQWPYLSAFDLTPEETQRLMDRSGVPDRAGRIYKIISDSHGRALKQIR